MTTPLDIKFENLLDEARISYKSGNYIRAWTLVGTAQSVIARKQEMEDRGANVKANRID